MTEHQPVLLRECLDLFEGASLKTFVDGTLGAGGHAAALLEAHPEIERFIGIDRDRSALEIAEKRLAPWSKKLKLCHGDFSRLPEFVQGPIDGILLDLGVSSMQLDRPERGFSFRGEGPLDMRMDRTQEVTAATIVNEWSEREILEILKRGEVRGSHRIASRIVQKRPFHTTTALTEALEPLVMRDKKPGLHPLTLVFQALRMEVNQELAILEKGLALAVDALAPGGRIAVITFHSLEDRLVKNILRFAASDKYDTSGIGGVFLDKEPAVDILTKKPIVATLEEVEENPRSRSAKLRGAIKR